MPRKLPVILLLVVALVFSGAARWLAGAARAAVSPEEPALAAGEARSDTLGRLNSFTLALLLGGLRGPLVMALWTSSETQKSSRELDDFDTKIELIRLLQPQFDTVHLYQIWNKAYNVSAEMTTPAAKYVTILDAVDYARKVLAERPANIDLETQLGEIFNNKLGGAQERDYYANRIYDETRADEPQTRVTFPASLEGAFRAAALRAGVSPRRLNVQRSQRAGYLVTGLRRDEADAVRARFGGEGVEYENLAARGVRARGVGGPLRLEPMLDEQGNLLADLTRPRRAPPADATKGTYLDGSPAQFLQKYAPFPSGVSPHALAYNSFMKAYVLQENGGQRHALKSAEFVQANPGRALRDWAVGAFEEGRLLEAEALGGEAAVPGNSGERQAALEQSVAGVSPDADPVSRELLERAVQRYERSLAVSRDAAAWFDDHLRTYPDANATFGSTVTRLNALEPLLRADVTYDRLILGQADDRAESAARAAALYADAYGRLTDYLLQYHTPPEFLPRPMSVADSLDLPPAAKQGVVDRLAVAAAAEEYFEHRRAVNEFGGYLARIRARLARLADVG